MYRKGRKALSKKQRGRTQVPRNGGTQVLLFGMDPLRWAGKHLPEKKSEKSGNSSCLCCLCCLFCVLVLCDFVCVLFISVKNIYLKD